MIKPLIWIRLGGFILSIVRYLAGLWIYRNFATAFPLGTFVVKVLVVFLIGLLTAVFSRGLWQESDIRLFLITGLCCGFTTFSAFSMENLKLIQEQQFVLASCYMMASLFVGLLATWTGYLLIK